MDSSFNPYQTPAGVDDALEAPATGVSPLTVEVLRKTRPWVLFLGIFGYFIAALIILGGVAFSVFGVAGGQGGGAFAIGAGLAYCLMGLLYLAPAMFLVRYAKGIKRLSTEPRVDVLNETLTAQKSFWKFVGIMVGLIFAMYAVIGIVALIAGGFAIGAASAQPGI